MASVAKVTSGLNDARLLLLAREIAMDIHDIETILKHYEIEPDEWETIKANSRFKQLLEGEVVAWETATNAHERVRLKAATAIEVWLPEAVKNIHDPSHTLTARTETVKVLTKLAGMGMTNASVDGSPGERFSVTINLGGDSKLTFDKPMKVIEGEAE